MSSLDLIGIVTLVGVVATITGRVLVGALRLKPLRRFDPANAAASAILGSAAWIVSLGWLSAAGLPVPRAGLVITGAHAPLLVLAWRRGLLSSLRPCGPARLWGFFVLVLLVAAGIGLLPVLRTGGFSVCNDTYHYSAFSEWLQHAGWSTPRPFEASSPVTYIPAIVQEGGLPLGAAYAVALVQAATGAASALVVFPAVSTWAVLLNVLGVVVLARWALRLTSRAALAASLGFALLPHPLYWGHHHGFLQQTCALPVLMLAIAVLTRALAPRQWRLDNAVLLALLVQYLLVVYLPALPVLGVAFIPFTVTCLRRARARGNLAQWLAAASMGVLLVALFGARELGAVFHRLRDYASAAVGWHVPLTRGQFLEFALGARIYGDPWTEGGLERLREIHLWFTPLYLGLVLFGLYRLGRRPRAWSLVAVAVFLGAAVAYYALEARDPWTHERGHTWSLFKLTQYSYPFLYLLLVAGLQGGRAIRLGRATRWTAAIAASSMFVALHWGWSEGGRSLRLLIRDEDPLQEVESIRRRFLDLPAGTLVVLGRPGSVHGCLASVLALLAYPRPIAAEWEGSGHVPPIPRFTMREYLERQLSVGAHGIVPILLERPVETEGAERLGGGLWTMPLRPRVLRMRSVRPHDLELTDGHARWRGSARLRLVVFSPDAGGGEVRLGIEPLPAATGEGRLRLGVQSLHGDLFDQPLREALHDQPRWEVVVEPGQTAIDIPVVVRRGLTTVVLSPEDMAGKHPPDRGLTITAVSWVR